MDFFLPAGLEGPSLAMVGFGHRGIGFELADKLIVGLRLLPREIDVEDEQRNQAHDGDVVGGRANLPKLSPVHKFSKPLQISRSDSPSGCRAGWNPAVFIPRPKPGRARGRPDSRDRLSVHSCKTWTAQGAVPTRGYSPAAFGPRRGLSASSVSMTGAGPEMPPSFRTRQK